MIRNTEIDLFNLIDENERRIGSWVMANGGKINSILKLLIEEIATKFGSKRKFTKYLQDKFNISQSTSERFVFLMKDWHPLSLLKEVADLTNTPYLKIQENINLLKINKPPLKIYKAVRELTEDLCKIVGAHAADGTINKNFFRITDGNKSNIVAFRYWLKNVFGINYPIRQISENEWGIEFHSGIITKYLTKIFSFPSGVKQYTVSEPEIIKTSSLNFRKCFALGALTFEAGVGIKHEIELCVSSKTFRDCISEILSLFDIQFTKMEKRGGAYWRLWSKKLSEKEARKWLSFFEEETEKWYKLNDYINGYKREVNSFDEAIKILDEIYSHKSSSKISIKDVLMAIKNLKKTYRYELTNYLCKNKSLKSYGGKWASSLRPYLDILERTNIIEVEKEKFGKKKSFGSIVREVYTYNQDVRQWKLPYRPRSK